MPIKSRVTKWKCKYCKCSYYDKEDTLFCEDKCYLKIVEEKFRRIFPKNHPNDEERRNHCVCCGKQLDCQWEIPVIFNGKYCLACYEMMKGKLYKLVTGVDLDMKD